MREIGGYIELDTYRLPMLHEGAVALNCGRNALAYLIHARRIRKIWIPRFICESVPSVCMREGAEVSFYSVGMDFRPIIPELHDGEWLYLVNYYGQLTDDEIRQYADRYGRVIVDQAQSYFQMPVPGVDTLYSCRKYFGVADGAFLYTDARIGEELPRDESYSRMGFLLGRYERTASEFYTEYKANNAFFVNEPIKKMSALTMNLLHGIDYGAVEATRKENYRYLHEALGKINMLKLHDAPGTFMYPLLLKNGGLIRKKLQEKKLYIPTLWPSVFQLCKPEDPEYQMAENILPLPIDQRYGTEEMKFMVREVFACTTW